MTTDVEDFFAAAQAASVAADGRVPRNHRDQPMIVPVSGDEQRAYKSGQHRGLIPYHRASSYGAKADDRYNLEKWMIRQAVRGMGIMLERGQLSAGPAGGMPRNPLIEPSEKSDKGAWDVFAEQCQTVAGSKVKADLGTAIHYGTELIDRGQSLSQVHPVVRERAEAYWRFCRENGIRQVDVETFGVEDEHHVAGTWDRTGVYFGRYTIGDVKGLALDTPLATPVGWTTMGDVAVGDEVIGADGRPTRVMFKSSPKRIGTYVVRFDDGAEIICDSEHVWWTERTTKGRGTPRARDVEEIRRTLRNPRSGQAWHRVPIARPLDLPDADLPIDPYLLGAWLGDGTASSGSITKDHALFDVFESRGIALGVRTEDQRRPHVVTARPVGLTNALRAAGLLNNKRIPGAYLRASMMQRLALLQGLLDTDGGWNKARGREVFSSTNERLARQVWELTLSLGQRPHISHLVRSGFGLEVDSWTVEFLPVDIEPHLHPRKRESWLTGRHGRPVPTTRSRRRLIVSIEPGPDVETACIAVDNADHLYLAGREMVPTHNTSGSLDFSGLTFAVQLGVYAHAKAYDPATGARTPHRDDIDLANAWIIHVDRNEGGPVTLHRVDIARGWRWCALVDEIIATRADAKTAIGPALTDNERMILRAPDQTTLRTVHKAYGATWTPEETALANRRWEELAP